MLLLWRWFERDKENIGEEDKRSQRREKESTEEREMNKKNKNF